MDKVIVSAVAGASLFRLANPVWGCGGLAP